MQINKIMKRSGTEIYEERREGKAYDGKGKAGKTKKGARINEAE
jgi:hypothetical protein